jgi:hypothetical protein
VIIKGQQVTREKMLDELISYLIIDIKKAHNLPMDIICGNKQIHYAHFFIITISLIAPGREGRMVPS